MRLTRYSPKAEYIPGKYMVVADAFSRDVISETVDICSINKDVTEYEIQAIQCLPVSRNKLEVIWAEQRNDEIIALVKSALVNGWPEIINGEVKEYYEKRSQLIIILDDILLYQNRIVIPNKMKKRNHIKNS